MKEEILRLISESETGMSAEDIATALGVDDSVTFKLLIKCLNRMIEDKEVTLVKDLYFIHGKKVTYTGKLIMKPQGFAFVDIGEDEDDIFIGKDYLNGALNGDEVVVSLLKEQRGSHLEGRVTKILERGNARVVGIIVERKGKLCCLSDDAKFKEVVILDGDLKGAMIGHKVVVKLTKFTFPFHGELIEILGHRNDPGVDILSIIAKYDLNIEFPKEVYEEVEAIPDYVTEEEMKGRVDFRNEMIITIDGDDSKDFDDAISLRKIGNHYLLGVHIADVSHYVKEGSPLDKEAIERGTSVYLVDRVIPMIPHKLSNGICSLNPGVDRLTISCIIELDEYANVLNHNIVHSVIHSKHRMTYNNVNKIFKHDRELKRQYSDIVDMLFEMKKLAALLRAKRDEKGAIDFDVDEAKVIVNSKGKAIDIVVRERGISERLIEEFMLLANVTVAEHFYHCDVPFIYRVHEHPKKNKLMQFSMIANRLGYKIKGSLNSVHPKELSSLIESTKDTPEHKLLSTLLLRCMQKARYDEQCLGHYGLADEYYTHFTSPIRRYPDLLVHRMITKYLFEGQINSETCGHFASVLPELAKQSSDREIDAMNCERDVNDMKMAEYMSSHIGEEFTGIISSVTNFGFFVELPNTIDGLVHISTLTDDYYEYIENDLMIVGRASGKRYHMSDTVNVRLVSVNKLDGKIDFEIVSKPKHRKKVKDKPMNTRNGFKKKNPKKALKHHK